MNSSIVLENSLWSVDKKISMHQKLIFLYIKGPEKAMAPHSSTLAWKIPWMEEPRGLQSMGLPRVGQDWMTSLSLFPFMHWRRKWQPTPVFLPRIPGTGEPGGLPSMGSQSWTRLKRLSSSSSSISRVSKLACSQIWPVACFCEQSSRTISLNTVCSCFCAAMAVARWQRS